jgi:hypothetical protein
MGLAALGLAFIVISSPTPVPPSASCPEPPPACDALQKASVVVVADVLEPEAAEVEAAKKPLGQNPLPPHAVRLRFVERFKGVSEDEQELAARIWYDTNTVRLEVGKRYLVYATRVQGYPRDVWNTGCSRTKPLDQAKDEVRDLRECAGR